jgi:hypothetical protein
MAGFAPLDQSRGLSLLPKSATLAQEQNNSPKAALKWGRFYTSPAILRLSGAKVSLTAPMSVGRKPFALA